MKRYIIIPCFLCCIACKNNSGSHLPRQVMRQVLLDAHLAESYSSVIKKDSAHKNESKNVDSLAVYYNRIFKHYNITQEQFYQSAEWYKNNPDELDSVYTLLVNDIARLENKRAVK